MGSWIENEMIELINSDQFRLSIPIQFQFQIFQFNSNSIHAELNWIDYQFQFNSWIDPSPVSGAPESSRGMLTCPEKSGQSEYPIISGLNYLSGKKGMEFSVRKI